MALWWLGEILTVEAIAGKYKGNCKTLRTFVLAMFPRAMSQFIFLADVLQIPHDNAHSAVNALKKIKKDSKGFEKHLYNANMLYNI